MERAIAKSKGVEFTSVLHQLGTDFDITPFSSRVRAILLEIAADAKLRFPKRKTRKKAEEEVTQPAAPEKAATKKGTTKKAASKKAAELMA